METEFDFLTEAYKLEIVFFYENETLEIMCVNVETDFLYLK